MEVRHAKDREPGPRRTIRRRRLRNRRTRPRSRSAPRWSTPRRDRRDKRRAPPRAGGRRYGGVRGRGPAALSAFISALSYEFFFTKPYNSLRIDSANDVETTLFLLAIALAVGQIAVHAHRTSRAASRGRDELASMRKMAERVAAGASDQELIDVAVTELTALMSLVGCRYEVDATGPVLPILERSGRIETPLPPGRRGWRARAPAAGCSPARRGRWAPGRVTRARAGPVDRRDAGSASRRRRARRSARRRTRVPR